MTISLKSNTAQQTVVRFAPSPSGRMHAGNIASALITWLFARLQNGKVVLRIEDLDRARSRQEFIDQILADFETLGLNWDVGPFYQSDNQDAYNEAFDLLRTKAHVYPCFCSRADLAAARAPHEGESVVYPGTCRHLPKEEVAESAKRKNPAYRIEVPQRTISFLDELQGEQEFDLGTQCGDAILRRADGGYSYQLAVSLDDAQQGITLVSRGYDLLSSTPLQIYLMDLLGFKAPEYAHLPLLVSSDGRRLSKRNADASIDVMLGAYHSPEGILGHIAFLYGLIDFDQPVSADDLAKHLDYETLINALAKQVSVVWKP